MTADNSYIVELFEDLVLPPITLSNTNEIIIPSITSIQIGGKQLIILLQSNGFHLLDLRIKKAILDILFILLRRSVYDLVRYASCYTNTTIESSYNDVDNTTANNNRTSDSSKKQEGQSFTKVLFTLLRYYTQSNDNNKKTTTDTGQKQQHTTATTTPTTYNNNDNNNIALRVIRLIGLSAVLGLDSQDIRMIFTMLNTPSYLTISLLQTLKIILKQDYIDNNIKALPSYFYNFNGHNSGLYSVLTPPCFYGEYQIMTWFRVEEFVTYTAPNVSPSEGKAKSACNPVVGDDDVYIKNNRDLGIPITTAPSSSSSAVAPVTGAVETPSYISLISIKSSEYIIEISIENHFLVVYIACNKSNESNKITIRNGYPGEDTYGFRRGVW